MLRRSITLSLLALVSLAGFAPAEDLVDSPLDTVLLFSPSAPNDNQNVIALMAHVVGACGWLAPEVLGVTRDGEAIRIDIASNAFFSGGLVGTPTGRPTKCTPPSSYLMPQEVPLGQLDAGTYDVSVYLTQLDASPEPITVLTNRLTLDVADAPDVVALHEGRFDVSADWTTLPGVARAGRPVPGPTDDSTLFTFFDPDNWELMAKVLDGCEINGHYWVFTAAATSVGYDLEITDTTSGATQIYSNPIGVRAPAVADITAFACSDATADEITASAIVPFTRPRAELPDEITPSPLGTEILFTPESADDNDIVTLLMAHALNNCGWSAPMATVTRDGFHVHIALTAYPGFGGGLAVQGSTKCSPAFPYIAPQRVELGRFEPGTYDVSITLTELGATDPKTILTHRTTFEVEDDFDLARYQDKRFSGEVLWTDFDGQTGRARPVPDPTDDSALFTFFDDDNWEILVKVLDGCEINNHYWVFTAAATNVEYDVYVYDHEWGTVWTSTNPLGTRAAAVADTEAFPCPTPPPDPY
ncbi:MAG: hypothetical protein AAGE94_11625 [Acidobacteriota bacterium]